MIVTCLLWVLGTQLRSSTRIYVLLTSKPFLQPQSYCSLGQLFHSFSLMALYAVYDFMLALNSILMSAFVSLNDELGLHRAFYMNL